MIYNHIWYITIVIYVHYVPVELLTGLTFNEGIILRQFFFITVTDIIWYRLLRLRKVNGREPERNYTYSTITRLSLNICPGMFYNTFRTLTTSLKSEKTCVYVWYSTQLYLGTFHLINNFSVAWFGSNYST